MKKISLLLVILSFAACSPITVSYDYDKQADFSKYKTYAYTESSLNLPIEQLDATRILNAVETQMTAKGFTKSDNPDVWVDIHIKTKQEVDATATTMGGGPWGYGYGGGFSTTQVSYNQYTVGTLVLNIVDAGSQKIVWQGVASKTVDPSDSPSQKDQSINGGMKQLFANYPYMGYKAK